MQRKRLKLTIRRKVILAFSIMFLLTGVGTGIVLFQLSGTVSLGSRVIQYNQPLALAALTLVKEVNEATALVNDYLLTGNIKFENKFYELKQKIQKTHKQILMRSMDGDRSVAPDDIQKTKQLLYDYYSLVNKVFYLKKNDLKNYPGLAVASELSDPYTLSYLGLLNELIDSEIDSYSDKERLHIKYLLNELRYSWVQMNNAFRIFMVTRSDTDLENFYNYSEVNKKTHKKLRVEKIDLGFGALTELESFRRKRLSNVPKIVAIFKSDAWRSDIYIMNSEIYPLLTEIKNILQEYSNIQVQSVNNDGVKLRKNMERTYLIVGLYLLIVLLLAVLVATLIVKSIKPIFKLTDAIKSSSIDVPVKIDGKLLQRPDEIGGLANAFIVMDEELRQDIKARRNAESKFETLLESTPDATLIVNEEGLITRFNHQAEILFGYSSAEVIGKSLDMLLPDRVVKNHSALVGHFMRNPISRPMGQGIDLYAVHKDGTEFPVEISLASIKTTEGLLVSASVRDITQRKETERLLLHQANYDTLTDLPNRVLAMDRLSHSIISAHRKHQSIAVMFIDLDNFKNVNDTLGHSVGDKLLSQVAQRISECVRANDTVARLGGDEFLIILPELAGIRLAEPVAEKIIGYVSRPYFIEHRELFVGASIGITGYPEDGDDPNVLLRNADAAMYKAKDAGRNTFRFFTSEMNEKLIKRLEIESLLRYALQNGELYIEYQPQLDLKSNRIIGAEALVRWNNAQLGLMPTEEFIDVAEDTGIINAIGEWVLRESCRAAKTWPRVHNMNLRLAVNISAVQFRSGDLVKMIADVLKETGFPANLLELEITERILIEDNPNMSRILLDLNRLGVRLVLDDFGTGYSSLSYLKRFPFDVLKIDRSFVEDMTVDPESASLCEAIVAMANSLSLNVIGEGVETVEQFNALRDLGTHSAQGFYISKPISNSQFISFVDNKPDKSEVIYI